MNELNRFKWYNRWLILSEYENKWTINGYQYVAIIQLSIYQYTDYHRIMNWMVYWVLGIGSN
jgi:hypothetical protein